MSLSPEKYLKRIGIGFMPDPTPESLARLQEAHLRTVPYENCEIFFDGQTPSLEPEALYDKIVERGRGGYCFELNGAFAWLLSALGFRFTQTFARWCFGEPDAIPPRRHRVLLVRFGSDTWIGDAGIGSPCPLTPLRLVPGIVQERNGLRFRIVEDPDHGFIVQKETPDGFLNFFSFWDVPHFTQDFLYVNRYCATMENSFFRKNLFVNLPAPDGRRSLTSSADETTGRTDFLLQLERENGTVDKRRIPADDKETLRIVLREYFSIRLSL